VFPVPSDYCITVDNNADYQVFKYHKYQFLSDTTWLEFIIYAGRHPSPVYKEYKKEKSAATLEKGTFLKKEIEWMVFDLKGQIIDKEQIFPAENISKDLSIHVVMLSNTKEYIDELTAIAEKFSLAE
ncbi:MAG: hypothetical protein ABI772_07890, partial [Bacteroidota bacterium]